MSAQILQGAKHEQVQSLLPASREAHGAITGLGAHLGPRASSSSDGSGLSLPSQLLDLWEGTRARQAAVNRAALKGASRTLAH